MLERNAGKGVLVYTRIARERRILFNIKYVVYVLYAYLNTRIWHVCIYEYTYIVCNIFKVLHLRTVVRANLETLEFTEQLPTVDTHLIDYLSASASVTII